MTHSLKKFSSLAIFSTAFFLFTTPALATKLVHRNLAELSTLADRIFIGVCLSVETKAITLEGQALLVMEYTFDISQAIKGVAENTLVFRQFGPASGVGSVIGMPSYQQGKNYMLFLGKDSEYGLTSPIGFGQGAFLVFTNTNGTTQALNTFGNRGLFRRMNEVVPLAKRSSMSLAEQKMMEKTAGPLEVGNLVSLVNKLKK